jgi:hypothetical protein
MGRHFWLRGDMQSLPEILVPTGFEAVTLPSGRTITLPKAQPQFALWDRAVTIYRYGNKSVLAHRGEQVYAELAILRLLQEAGWQGVWIDTYRRKFRTDTVNSIALPPEKRLVYERIRKEAGGRGGCFDVFAWKDGELLFAEAKRHKRDRFQRSQGRWLEAALGVGFEKDSFLVVEWTAV